MSWTKRQDGVAACAFVVLLIAPVTASAQPDTQIWANFNFDWVRSHQTTLGVDVEPKVLVSAPAGDPGWATFDVIPSFEFTRGLWLDVVNELLVGRTKQTDDLDSTEVTPRFGLRLHILSNLRTSLEKEKRPKKRLVLRDLARVEWRNLFYSTDKPNSSTVRFRNRVELLWAINRGRISDNGALYLQVDDEWFWPLDEPDERYANKQRIRSGLGYRHSSAWRYEAFFVLNRSRKSADASFTDTDYVAEVTMKRVW